MPKDIPKSCCECQHMNRQSYVQAPDKGLLGVIQRRAWIYFCELSKDYIARDDASNLPKECEYAQ